MPIILTLLTTCIIECSAVLLNFAIPCPCPNKPLHKIPRNVCLRFLSINTWDVSTPLAQQSCLFAY